MENATKALLIAAAALIVIVIIALGVRILSSTQDTDLQAKVVAKEISSKTEGISEATTKDLQGTFLNEKEKFNLQFERYFGKEVSAEKTRELVGIVMKNNEQSDQMVFIAFQQRNEANQYKTTISIHNKNKITSKTNGKKILDAIKDDKIYRISITHGCSVYGKEAYTSEGYVGCICIAEL